MSPVRTQLRSEPGHGGVRDRARAGFAVVLAVQCLIAATDTTIVLALPAAGADLGIRPAYVSWVVNGYLIALGGFLLVGGWAADRLGRRRALVVGLAAFAAASLVAGLASGQEVLVGARAAQGLAGAAITPAAMGLLGDLFPDEGRRARAVALFGGVGGVAGAAGGIVGGAIAVLSWRWVLLVGAPLSLVLLLLALTMLPEVPPLPTAAPDVLGAVLGVVASILVLSGMVRLGAMKEIDPTSVALLASGAIALIGFVARLARARSPLVPRHLLADRGSRGAWAATAVVGFQLFGGFFALAVALQAVRDVGPLVTALWQLPVSLAVFVGSRLGAAATARHGVRRVLRGGFLAQSVGMLAAAVLADGPLPVLAASFSVWGAGVGVAIVAGFVGGTSAAGAEERSLAAGVVNTCLQVGGAAGVALLGTALAWHGTVDVSGARIGWLLAAVVAVAASTGTMVGGRPVPTRSESSVDLRAHDGTMSP